MYNTGKTGFLAAACSPNRVIDTKAVFDMGTKVNLSTNDIISYKAIYASTGGKAFAPGSFVASQLELSLNAASSVVSGMNFKTTPVNSLSLSAGVQVYPGMVYVPMGKFYPEKDGIKANDDGTINVTATDIPPVMYTEFKSSMLTLPCTVREALDKIAAATGLTLVITASNFPNLSIQLTESFSLVSTYRAALMYISETLGGYIQMGRNGEICVKKCFSGLVNIGAVLDDNYLFSVKKQENSVKPFQYINIKANKNDLGVVQAVSGVTTNCSYEIVDNPLTYGHPQDFLEGLVAPTTFTEFYPASISFHGRPDIDTGDVLSYAYKGVTYILPVCKHVFEYNGGFKTTVESIGSDSLVVSSADSGTKAQITSLRQNINEVSRDLNQTQSQIVEINGQIVNLSSILQTVNGILSRVEKIEGDYIQSSALTQEANRLNLAIKSVEKDLTDTNNKVNDNQKTLLTYFDFQADGLIIGVNTSDIKLRLINDQIQFLKEGNPEPVAYFSEGQLYVTDAHFIRSLVLGNFEFVPRSNGNLSLKRRG